MARHIDPENLSPEDLQYLDDRSNIQRDLELHLGKPWKEIRAALADKVNADEESDEDDSSDEGGSEPQGDEEENGEDQEDDEEAEDYSEWEYHDLQAEVKERGLEPESRKAEDLIAALVDDDLNSESDEDSDSDEE